MPQIVKKGIKFHEMKGYGLLSHVFVILKQKRKLDIVGIDNLPSNVLNIYYWVANCSTF